MADHSGPGGGMTGQSVPGGGGMAGQSGPGGGAMADQSGSLSVPPVETPCIADRSPVARRKDATLSDKFSRAAHRASKKGVRMNVY